MAPASFTLWSNETYVNVPGFEAQTKNPGDWDKFLAAEYMKVHPEVKINVEVVLNEVAQAKMIAAVQANQPPDIYFDSGCAHGQVGQGAGSHRGHGDAAPEGDGG